MFWATMLSSASTFNAAFAIRLGASNTIVSLLTSLPALLAFMIAIPAGQFLNSRRQTKPWLLGSLAIHRAGYLLVLLSPLMSLFGIPPGTLVVLAIVATSPPASFFNVGFIPMLTEVIPEKKRAGVLAARNIIYNITFSLCGLLLGLWLDRVIFPFNYQAMYLFGIGCSFISIYFLVKIQVSHPSAIQQPAQATGASTQRSRLFFRDAFQKHPGFVRIAVNTLLHGLGLWAISPLYVLYYVRTLGASDTWLGLLGTVSSLSTIFGYIFWRWLMGRWGEAKTLKRTIVLAGIFPILVGLLPSLSLILIAAALNGLLSPGIGLSHMSTLMKVTPADNRPGYTAVYMTLNNIGAFLLPFAGIALANRFSFAPILIAFGLLSVIGSTSFLWWPVKTPDDERRLEALPVPQGDASTETIS
jgi:MFS family permease